VSVRAGDGWDKPQLFAPEALSDSEDFYPIITRNGNLYFNSQREGPGTNNIFRAAWTEGEYEPAEKLPAPINSDFREFDAFVSPEEDLILFSSDRPGGLGRADIYLSRLKNGRWSEPKNLGASVNSEASEYGAMLSPDGRFLFFTSSRTGMEDIYWISAAVLGLSTG
jgi:Tol biopolymer transport system component